MGIIHDVVMVQEGEAKGHDVHLDSEFINDIVKYDQKHFSDRGLKARFGHPGASSETMGTQLGIFKNFRHRVEAGKSQAIADLHLLEASEYSPTHQGMRSWVLKMAEEQPDFMMSSIVFQGSGYYQRDPDGKKHKLEIAYTEDHDRYLKGYKAELGPIFIGLGDHYYTDLVEAGAATENLFSNQVNPHLFVAQADQFLYDHPELKEFIQANPDKVSAFLATLGINITSKPRAKKMANKFNFLSWLMGEAEAEAPEGEDLETIRTELSTAREEIITLKTAKETAENQLSEAKQDATALQSAVGELEEQLSKATRRIEALEQQPAAPHSGGPTDLGIATEKPSKTKELYDRYGIK